MTHQPELDALRERIESELQTLLNAQGVQVQFVTGTLALTTMPPPRHLCPRMRDFDGLGEDRGPG